MPESNYILKSALLQAISVLYGHEFDTDSLQLSETKKEFTGHYTLVVFPFTRYIKSKPEEIAEAIGQQLLRNASDIIDSFNVIKGFLNLSMKAGYWHTALEQARIELNKRVPERNETVLVEYSSPNTNKPLHLGHIRNILLGWSVSRLFEAQGYKVLRTKVVNDRGIAICKSMLAWQLYGENSDPSSFKVKGDHFVGRWYVVFEQRFKEEYSKWQESREAELLFASRENQTQDRTSFFAAFKNEYFNQYSQLGAQAKALLLKWEASDPETIGLWKRMNQWVYEGFDETYKKLGVGFDSRYYESDTYLLGKDLVEYGLQKACFYRQQDNSVWVDLTDSGLDKKILLRSDGTSVYITQDLGTARIRYQETGAKRMIYVVADEQDYHFQVLFEILKRLGEPYAEGLYHLSYGMVDLPSGKMKSREGTVVDADDLIAEVIGEARNSALERGELAELSEEDKEDIFRKIGLAALKYFILKVNPKKRMIFDPVESVDLQGQTGPYIQNAYVRIRSVLRKWDGKSEKHADYTDLHPAEIELIACLSEFPDQLSRAAENYDPSGIAGFAYELARRYHRFYHDVRILNAETPEAKSFRLELSSVVAEYLNKSMNLLGIEMPERM